MKIMNPDSVLRSLQTLDREELELFATYQALVLANVACAFGFSSIDLPNQLEPEEFRRVSEITERVHRKSVEYDNARN